MTSNPLAQRLNLWALVAAALLLLFPASSHAEYSNRLPETRALETDLASTQSSIRSSRMRQERLKSKIRDVRKQMESIKQLIAGLKKVEQKVGRLEREVSSYARIPKLGFLKPLEAGLKSLRKNIAKVRQRGEEMDRKILTPNINRARHAESKISKLILQLRGLESKNAQALQNLTRLRTFAEARINQRSITSALEQLAREARRTIRPFKTGLQTVDQRGASAESAMNAFANTSRSLLSLRGGLEKLNRILQPVDKKVKAVAKVLDKKLQFKVPLIKKTVTFSVRKILESPGKILKAALKPLTKLAQKALKPLSKNLKINLKAPAEIARMSQYFDQLLRLNLGMESLNAAVDRYENSASVRNFERSLDSVINKRSSQLR